MKGRSELLTCAMLLYCRMFRLIWSDFAVRQKVSGPRCVVIVAERVEAGGRTPENLKK